MEFKTTISSLERPFPVKIQLVGTKLPNNNDVFFRAKQSELIDQYRAARIFLRETETTDWNHWFNPIDDAKHAELSRLMFRSYFYETALFYYNLVVDLSWTLCYVAIEFACTNKGIRVNISGIKPIEESTELLRKAEGNVTSPTAEENPFLYLKRMCPEFEPVIDQIVCFWNSFCSTDIRKRYNFCKHKGKPAYEEIERLSEERTSSFFFGNRTTGEFTQIASTPQDVKYTFSLEDAISELRDFDDNHLFPYIQNLISTIENILQPSPMVR